MTTCTTSVATSVPDVIDLRPRAMARRATALREQLIARRRRVAPGHHRLLDIVIEALDRTAGVPDEDLDAWERLLKLVETHDGVHAVEVCAAAANLFGLAVFDDVTDHVALADLSGILGHARAATLQHRHGTSLEVHAGLPLTTRAIRCMVAPELRGRLAQDPTTEQRVDRIVDASLRAAHALLGQGNDSTWAVPVLDSPHELDDIASHGTVVEWRHHFALVSTNPWSAYTARIVEIAELAGRSDAAVVITAIVDLCRQEAAVAGRDPAPRESGGLVAVG